MIRMMLKTRVAVCVVRWRSRRKEKNVKGKVAVFILGNGTDRLIPK